VQLLEASFAGVQLLFPLRDIPRATTYEPKFMLGAGSVAALDALVLLLRCAPTARSP
jgi:hypothetical protein